MDANAATSMAPNTSPAVDSAGAPVAAADATVDRTPADDSADNTTDDLKGARAERDAAKRARRDAEARADALAARVAVLESQAAEAERLRGELSTVTSARNDERKRQAVGKIEQAMAPPMRGSHVALLIESFATSRGLDLTTDDGAREIERTLRAHSPGLFVPASSQRVPPSSFRSPI